MTTLTMPEYFSNRHFFSYFLNVFGDIHYLLPGVFEGTPVDQIVNFSLWTVPFELECYIAISIISLFKPFKRRKLTFVAFLLITLAVLLWNKYNGINGTAPGAVNGRILVICFLSGVLFFIWRHSVPYDGLLVALSAALSLCLLRYDVLVYAAPLPVAYATVGLGHLNPKMNRLVSSGDYSYGIYLYAWPVQQCCSLLLGQGGSWSTNIALALPLTTALAVCSWFIVERPTLALKRFVRASRLGNKEPTATV